MLLTDRGKIPQAIKTEFFEQLDKPFINELKIKYGQYWEEAYKHCKDENVAALHALNEIITSNTKTKETKPKSPNKYSNLFEEYAKNRAA